MLGYFEIEVFIPSANSLKEKRLVLNSIKDRTRRKYNVSIAELSGNETWQRSLIGMALVANKQGLIEETFDKIQRMLDQDDRFEIIDRQVLFYN